MHDGEPLPYTLRNHHEIGIGMVLQVDMAIGNVVTACRISDETQSMTVRRSVTVDGMYELYFRT